MGSKIFAVAGLLTLTLSVACGMVPRLGASADPSAAAQSDAQPGPTVAVPTPAAGGTPVTASPKGALQALVKKDSIVQMLSVDGVVAAKAEVPVTYQGSGKVQDVKVKVGQAVNEGDVLLELDAVEINRSLSAAQARAQASKANLAQVRAQLAAQQRTAAQRAAANQQQQQQAVADAQAGLRKAQSQLDTVMAGASNTDRHAAQTALINAQTALQKAQAAQDKLLAMPDSATVRQARVDVTYDQIAVDKANAELNALTRGPDPIVLQQAQRDVERAKTNLLLTQSAKLDANLAPAAAKLAHDSAIADAQLAVQTAQDKLDKITQPPADYDVQTAQQKVQNASDILTVANAKFASLGTPADQDQLDLAETSVETAQTAVDDAQARVDSINNHPTPLEMADAQDQVRRAQTAVDAARSPSQTATDSGGVDLGALQDSVNQDDADVASLQQQLDTTRIVAPFTGTVLSVRVKPGDAITSAKPVFTLTQPGQPIIRLQLSDDEAKQVSMGQKATVVLDPTAPSSAAPITAAITRLVTAAQSGAGSPTAELVVDWPNSVAPRFGVPVTVNVKLQEKPGVLVVPKSAVRSTGARTYVEVLDGAIRRITNVQVGIASTDNVEIVSGLTEGQVVLLSS